MGQFEAKATAECLNYMSAGLADKRPGQQWHRISHRVLHDMQHRFMVRPATEDFNLAVHHNDHDVTNAEFIRTYRSCDFAGKALVRRWELETGGRQEMTLPKVLPVQRGPVGSRELTVEHFDELYGFRGTSGRLYYLSAWEFVMLWEVKSLDLQQTGSREAQEAELLAYLAEHPEMEPYPRTGGGSHLRHKLVMMRAHTPYVPAPASCPMPDRAGSEEEKSRLFSLYLRPWVLDHHAASRHVPHLARLCYIPAASIGGAKRRRCSTKMAERVAPPDAFTHAWRWYLRGHVVSHHAKRIITQFLAASCGKSTTREDEREDAAAVPSREEASIANDLSLARVHGVLQQMVVAGRGTVNEDGEKTEECLRRSKQIDAAVRVGEELWGLETMDWGAGHVDYSGALARAAEAAPSGPAAKSGKPSSPCAQRGKQLETQANAYVNLKSANVKAWFKKVLAEEKKPNPEQLAFLKDVADRCEREAQELKKHGETPTRTSEPMRACLLGVPGGGKSECIKWTCRFFTECLGWTAGVQFQCLASQNTFANQIGGQTFHHWGSIPVNAAVAMEGGRRAGGRGVDEVYLRCLAQRWLVADEISSAPLDVLGLLESNTRRASKRKPYAVRPDGLPRPLGGLNLVLCGDWWQLPPVASPSIFSNPFLTGYSPGEQRILRMFWHCNTKGEKDCMQACYELVQEMRCKDPFLSEMLEEDRLGRESWETYCFVHGLPTRNPGSWLRRTGRPTCTNGRCARLAAEEWPQMFRDRCSWDARRALECDACAAERRRRCRVLRGGEDSRHLEEPFVHAPYVHPFNAPKYHAQQLRAVHFAKAKRRRLLWTVAYDKPLTADDAYLSSEALRQQRQRWLELHDKQTNGLGGLLPLVKEMPLRVTTTLDRDRAVFKNSRAKLLGWTLPAEEEERILPLDDPEIVLTRRPLSLEIEVETHDAPVTYTLKPQVRVWSRDRERNATVRRVGFPVVPEFGGTAHAYCGTTLESCLGDLLAWSKKPRRDDMLRGYIIKSRVKEWDKILLVQPYSPRLFAQGELPGPSLLMKVLRHEMTTEAARKAWKEQEDSEAATGGQEWPQELPLPCKGLHRPKRRSRGPEAAAGVHDQDDSRRSVAGRRRARAGPPLRGLPAAPLAGARQVEDHAL